MQCHDNLIDDSGRLVFMMTVIEILINIDDVTKKII